MTNDLKEALTLAFGEAAAAGSAQLIFDRQRHAFIINTPAPTEVR